MNARHMSHLWVLEFNIIFFKEVLFFIFFRIMNKLVKVFFYDMPLLFMI